MLCHFVAPIAKRTFGEFHDVAFVHQGDAFSIKPDRVANGTVNQAHSAGITHRFDPDSDTHIVGKIFRADACPKLARFFFCSEPDLLELLWKFFSQKIENLLRLRRRGRVFNSGVNVFRVLAENNHVHFFRVFYGRGDTPEILNRPQTDVEIEQLPQRDI